MDTRFSKFKILVILGPTSTGKTDLALQFANQLQGELVSCDSRQVYAGLDIGTGKLPGKKVAVKKGRGFWEMDGIKVWMYDVADFKNQYTVYDYLVDANRVIDDIVKRGKLPIIVGGTGLYLKALLEGLPNLGVPLDLQLRKELEKLSLEELQRKLQKLSPKRWEKMNDSDRKNPRRLVRAIEVEDCRGRLGDLATTKEQPIGLCMDVLKIGLSAPREILYQRIDERIISRMDQGMIQEAEKLHKKGLSLRRMKQLGLEYGVLADYLEGRIKNKEELVKILQGKIHGYARRQITWFKKEKNVLWCDTSDEKYMTKLEKMVRKWYDTGHAAKN